MTEMVDGALFDVNDFRDPTARRLLRERFVVPPLSVLDSSQGYWQERKRNWLALGIESEVGRDARAFNMGLEGNADNGWKLEDSKGSGTSVFDPVLCELVYRWWCPAAGVVLDPFAGGSVRGVVAATLGRDYHGVDLRTEQVEANRDQAATIGMGGAFPEDAPTWYVGDAMTTVPDIDADLIFSCPPYGDLEVYSDDPGDLSRMSPEAFHVAYRRIIAAHVRRLLPDRFAVFVVGNYRGERTGLVDLAGLTVAAFRDAGMDYYADMALVTPVGRAAVRASATFDAGRKPIRRHQYVLVFVKGDWKRAAAAAEETVPA